MHLKPIVLALVGVTLAAATREPPIVMTGPEKEILMGLAQEFSARQLFRTHAALWSPAEETVASCDAAITACTITGWVEAMDLHAAVVRTPYYIGVTPAVAGVQPADGQTWAPTVAVVQNRRYQAPGATEIGSGWSWPALALQVGLEMPYGYRYRLGWARYFRDAHAFSGGSYRVVARSGGRGKR